MITGKDIENWKAKIDKMSHEEMASLYRFAPSGHPAFDNTSPIAGYFNNRFQLLGGMTAEISKKIGW